MIWKDYSKLKGLHAFCGASNYHWRNYTIEKLIRTKFNSYSASIGTHLHDYAAKHINYRMKLKKTGKDDALFYLVDKSIPRDVVDMDRIYPTLMNYVNDAIGFRMSPEVVLYYSDNFYGTCDAISWNNKCLRIHDLKTGENPGSFLQLENYAAFFCLDYKVKPTEIDKIEFRIYQNGDIVEANPEPKILVPIIDQIIEFNKALINFRSETIS